MVSELSLKREEWIWVAVVAAGVLALASLPYLAVYAGTPPDLRFVGTLLNPLDGDTYLAKMQMSAQGDWLFHLPYTWQDHSGVLVYVLYIVLGKAAAGLAALGRWPLVACVVWVYHLARVMAGAAFLFTAYGLIARLIEPVRERRLAFLFVALSSGLGWIAIMAGHLASADMQIPESNNFFSLHINPHFALALALMAGFVTVFLDGNICRGVARVRVREAHTYRASPRAGLAPAPTRVLGLIGLALGLAFVQPFAVVTLYLALGVYFLVTWRWRGRLDWAAIWMVTPAGALALPVMVYSLWALQSNPVLRGWNAQNITLSPPVWDYVLGYGLLIPFAAPAAWQAWRDRREADLFLLTWIAVTALLLYVPLSLQRRFSLGLHIPVALLAAKGLAGWLEGRSLQWRGRLAALAFAATLPTTLLILIVALGAGLQHDPRLYLAADEAAAMDWLREQTPRGAVALSGPQTGLFIPAWSGRRVVYGHPFETPNAEATRARVETFFAANTGSAQRQALLAEWGAAYVFIGPRERALRQIDLILCQPVFRNATVAIYDARCAGN